MPEHEPPTGAWELPEEFRLLAETVRRFMATEVRPLEDKLEHDAAGLPPELLLPLQEKARELGLWALQTPAEYGGAGLSVLGQVVVAEEAAKCRMGAFFPAAGAFGGNPPSVLFKASPEQFERFARPIIEGRTGKAYTAISESSGGSDPARAIRCRAERRGDHYVLNGTKLWTSHALTADWGVVYARTGEQGERGGISCFVVERDTPGLSMVPIEVMNSFSPAELRFDDAEIPVGNRIGAEGAGFALASDFLVRGRILYAAGPIGIAQQALEMTVEWVKDRAVFGSRLSDKQGVQWMLADSEIELRAARLLTYQAAWNADLGRDVRVDASAAKLYATETAFRVLDRCVQLFGALGLSREMPLERWFRDLRVKRLGEGATEVQRMVVARHLLK
ncbi:acyl-CoA dehydrogenase family protein [Amycolatopsis acidiphila]|uniref:Acyl-CoA dehydrogenase n=1 Tax=Amycolatopsis acidiphila TaxID=715473 RepID=A0A558AP54_9PSEU|nr:acyl-CoA dehydrogenase family protein [Amycolatopsis acidiphila]TVT26050.1 acyl-CoA dehydrogenase [Amycolatopsis acidiphila]UIJ63229.1 acyl-CoA dehydrogenase family protein [Amycolatopsis acidiphila]GHG74480.1 acyl-CoA dehydrogenase [Amycolatopsis acidiphila]